MNELENFGIKEFVEKLFQAKAPYDLNQKIFQVILSECKQSIIDLLLLALPQIEDLNPLVDDIRMENITISPVEVDENNRRKLLAEKRLDYLVKLTLPKAKCEIYLLILHQSSANKLIELEMAQYIIGQYLKEARQSQELLGTISLIINTTVDNQWRPKKEFVQLLKTAENSLIKKSSLNFPIYSLNINDSKFKDLPHDKPIILILVLEKLRKKGLSQIEVDVILEEAALVLEYCQGDSMYEQLVKWSAQVICTHQPETEGISRASIAKLAEKGYFDRSQVKELQMTIGEQRERKLEQKLEEKICRRVNAEFDRSVNKAVSKAVNEAVNEAVSKTAHEEKTKNLRAFMLALVEKHFGLDQALEEQINAINEYPSDKELVALILDSEDKEAFQKQIKKLSH